MAPTPKRGSASNPVGALVAVVLIVIICVLAWLAYATQQHSREHIAQNLMPGATAESQLIVVGTLSTLGSFEWDVAPLRTHIKLVADVTATKLLRGELSNEEAEKVQDQLVDAKSLLDEAQAICRQSNSTGKCGGDESKARALLDQARAVLASVSY